MQRIDLLIAGAILLAIGGTAVGLLTYDDSGGTQWSVTWTTEEVRLDTATTTLQGAGSVELTTTVEIANLTGLAMDVRISGPGPRVQALTYHVEVIAPNGTSVATREGSLGASATGGAEELTLELLPFSTPAEGTVTATDAASALAAAAPDAAPYADATGRWTVRVSIAGGLPSPTPQEALTIEATPVAAVYEGSATPYVPDIQR